MKAELEGGGQISQASWEDNGHQQRWPSGKLPPPCNLPVLSFLHISLPPGLGLRSQTARVEYGCWDQCPGSWLDSWPTSCATCDKSLSFPPVKGTWQ